MPSSQRCIKLPHPIPFVCNAIHLRDVFRSPQQDIQAAVTFGVINLVQPLGFDVLYPRGKLFAKHGKGSEVDFIITVRISVVLLDLPDH